MIHFEGCWIEQLPFAKVKRKKKKQASFPSLDQLLSTANCGPAAWRMFRSGGSWNRIWLGWCPKKSCKHECCMIFLDFLIGMSRFNNSVHVFTAGYTYQHSSRYHAVCFHFNGKNNASENRALQMTTFCWNLKLGEESNSSRHDLLNFGKNWCVNESIAWRFQNSQLIFRKWEMLISGRYQWTMT